MKSGIKQESIPLAENNSRVQCYTADFEKPNGTGSEGIRVRWSWSEDGTWKAPDSPRFHFMRASLLYKIYLVHPLGDDEDLTKDDPYRKFVADLVPTLGKLLPRAVGEDAAGVAP